MSTPQDYEPRGETSERTVIAIDHGVYGIYSPTMAEVFRFPTPPPPPAPKSELRATFFTVIGGTGRPLTCAAFDVETGLELRLFYSDDDVMRSQLFRSVDREEQVAEMADGWRRLLLEKGFSEAG